jgi:hypothetical protein
MDYGAGDLSPESRSKDLWDHERIITDNLLAGIPDFGNSN